MRTPMPWQKTRATIGLILIAALFWLPMLQGLRAAFDDKYATIPESYSAWWRVLKECFIGATGGPF